MMSIVEGQGERAHRVCVYMRAFVRVCMCAMYVNNEGGIYYLGLPSHSGHLRRPWRAYQPSAYRFRWHSVQGGPTWRHKLGDMEGLSCFLFDGRGTSPSDEERVSHTPSKPGKAADDTRR